MTEEEREYFRETFKIVYVKTHSRDGYEYGYYMAPHWDEKAQKWVDKPILYKFKEAP